MSRMTAPSWTIEPSHLSHARELCGRHLLRTPLVSVPSLGPDVLLKLETEQLTGSFKVRGALSRIGAMAREEDARPIVTASAGNHGLGVAWAARRLGRTARVYVPAGAPLVKRAGIAALGAEIVVTDGPGYDATERVARAAAEAEELVFVSPFDDPWVAAGNGGTVGLELFEALPEVARVVAPVGGGGLMAGLAAARRHLGRGAELVGVQSEASPAMHRSLAEGRAIEELPPATTLAEGLEGGVSSTTYALVRDAVSSVDLVAERDIAEAMRFARDTLGLTVEGSAATVLAWARDRLPDGGTTVLVITGRNVD